LGYPINTISNDIFYIVLPNKNAYHSSVRRGGHGQSDIYLINMNGINISGVARLNKAPHSIISKLVVSITNKQGTSSFTDKTDASESYSFAKLSPDDDFDLFIEEIDEENMEDAIYTMEGQVTKMGKPLERVEVGNQKTEQDGAYKLKFIKKGGSNKQLEV
jgi:hypothetical protein